MVGNAVPPRVAFFLAKSIKDCLKKNANDFVLVGYVKSEQDLSIIREKKVYYIRGGNRPGALSFSQLDHPIKRLLLHRGYKRYYFELNNERAISCDKNQLRKIGFVPQGDNYWLFNIKKELFQDDISSDLQNKVVFNTNKPLILNILE